MKKFKQFINENTETPYVDLVSNLRKFFEEEGMGDINIVAGDGDKQTMTIELPYKISKKESWWEEFVEICNKFGYNEIHPTRNIVLIYRSLGIFNEPNGYTQFYD